MNMLPKQEPTTLDVECLAYNRLKRVKDSDAYQALRWSRTNLRSGILYASHLPLPWGCYFHDDEDVPQFVWTVHLEVALFVLSRVDQ